MSLKFETTTTFFNVGIRTKLRQSEIDSRRIKDSDGKKLLESIRIDNKRFCTIFNDKVKTNGGEGYYKAKCSCNTRHLESGIGNGYHVIHKMRAKSYLRKWMKLAMKSCS